MISVDEVDVSVARWAEEDGVAEGASGGGVRGWVVGAEVGFGLDDASGKDVLAVATDENLAQEFAGDDAWIAIEEGAGQGL